MNRYRFNGLKSKFRGHISRENEQTDHLYVQLLFLCFEVFKFFAAMHQSADDHFTSVGGLVDRLGLFIQLVADGRADEVGAVGIKSFLD